MLIISMLTLQNMLTLSTWKHTRIERCVYIFPTGNGAVQRDAAIKVLPWPFLADTLSDVGTTDWRAVCGRTACTVRM